MDSCGLREVVAAAEHQLGRHGDLHQILAQSTPLVRHKTRSNKLSPLHMFQYKDVMYTIYSSKGTKLYPRGGRVGGCLPAFHTPNQGLTSGLTYSPRSPTKSDP